MLKEKRKTNNPNVASKALTRRTQGKQFPVQWSPAESDTAELNGKKKHRRKLPRDDRKACK
jgi:hypothetical protein